jgi:capsule polysaccharide export protein KpsE/RkpR
MATSTLPSSREVELTETPRPANWVAHTTLLWQHRVFLARVTAIAIVVSFVVAFAIPKQYKSSARIMPPDQQGAGALMLAALSSRGGGGLGALGSLAGGLLSSHTTTALFVDLLHSATVSGHLIERFQLQHAYHKRYLIDTAKFLARRTTITDDKKSGVITIAVEDTDRVRARDLTQAYLDELNKIVTQTSTSSAHQERIFVERRLQSVEKDLEEAQLRLSEFSSRNSTISIGDQTKAMVDAAARVQAEILVEQSGLNALRQIYGDSNVRIRETEARISSLQHQLENMSGSSAPLAPGIASGSAGTNDNGDDNQLYPPLRQLPRLAVPYADLYRRVKVQETVYELLTQQFEMARIEEAKDVPIVSVIDPPGIAEKKSFPPRLLLIFILTAFSFVVISAAIIMADRWHKVDPCDPRKVLAGDVLSTLHRNVVHYVSRKRGTR